MSLMCYAKRPVPKLTDAFKVLWDITRTYLQYTVS